MSDDKFKIGFLICFLPFALFATVAPVARGNINFKEKITKYNLVLKNIIKIHKHCVPFNIDNLKKGTYTAKHYIRQGSVICTKDVQKYNKKSVLFNFGSIEIEKEGKIIFENDKYIKIRKQNGKIEKIYKDGRIR